MSDFDDLRLEGGRLEDGRHDKPEAVAGGPTVRLAKTGGFHAAKLAPLSLAGSGSEPIGLLEGKSRKAGTMSTPHLPHVSGAPPVTVSTYAAAKPLQ
jgi:hypothetical protein